MPQTEDNRIYRHYNSLTKNACCSKCYVSPWMTLARHWKMPIRDIKRVIAGEKERISEERKHQRTCPECRNPRR